jgi:hypothetical protein
MSTHLPPRVGSTEFNNVDTKNTKNMKALFAEFVKQMHDFLNQLPCLRPLQEIRSKWLKGSPRSNEAFVETDFIPAKRYWYTKHHGGRNEGQFNIGLCAEGVSVATPAYLRLGLGFEFTKRMFGEPEIVAQVYRCWGIVNSCG